MLAWRRVLSAVLAMSWAGVFGLVGVERAQAPGAPGGVRAMQISESSSRGKKWPA